MKWNRMILIQDNKMCLYSIHVDALEGFVAKTGLNTTFLLSLLHENASLPSTTQRPSTIILRAFSAAAAAAAAGSRPRNEYIQYPK